MHTQHAEHTGSHSDASLRNSLYAVVPHPVVVPVPPVVPPVVVPPDVDEQPHLPLMQVMEPAQSL